MIATAISCHLTAGALQTRNRASGMSPKKGIPSPLVEHWNSVTAADRPRSGRGSSVEAFAIAAERGVDETDGR
jgi:hypothetical protein